MTKKQKQNNKRTNNDLQNTIPKSGLEGYVNSESF
jgi:hypothetical protein